MLTATLSTSSYCLSHSSICLLFRATHVQNKDGSVVLLSGSDSLQRVCLAETLSANSKREMRGVRQKVLRNTHYVFDIQAPTLHVESRLILRGLPGCRFFATWRMEMFCWWTGSLPSISQASWHTRWFAYVCMYLMSWPSSWRLCTVLLSDCPSRWVDAVVTEPETLPPLWKHQLES